MTPSRSHRTALATLLILLCLGADAPAVQARATRSVSNHSISAATLKGYVGLRVRLALGDGYEVVGILRQVWPRHVRVEDSHGRYVSISIRNIRSAASADTPRGSPLDPRVRKMLGAKLKVPGKLARNIGIGMTFGGMAAGLIPYFIMRKSEKTSTQAMAGASLGTGLIMYAGVVTWVVGSVYMKTHASHPDAEDNRRTYRILGMGLTLGGLGLTAAGLGIAFGMASRGDSLGTAIAGIIIGSALAGTGVLAALLVGVPMWITAAAAKSTAKDSPRRPRSKPYQVSPLAGTTDPHHERTFQLRLTGTHPRASIFNFGSRF